MHFKPFEPFPINSKFINPDGSNWAGGFTSTVEPSSYLSKYVPTSNAFSASASALKGGSRRKKNNMKIYNRMGKRSSKRMSKRMGKVRRGSKRRMGTRRMTRRRGLSRRPMRGGVGNWIKGVSANVTGYSMPGGNLQANESYLANPTYLKTLNRNI
jgi:hypothetical protein